MKDKDVILEAHVQFELRRFSGEKLKDTLQEEISSLFGWCEHVKVNDVVRSAQLADWIQRYVIEMPISDEVMDFIRENVVVVYEYLQDDRTRVEEILPRKLFDRIIEVVIGLEDLRRSITHQVVSSSVYTMLISDVLYHGIKSFVLTENGFTKNIPGASSFVRLGQNALSAAAPKMEKNVDRQLTAFINAHMQETTAESESFLNKVLDAKSIRELGDEIWDANAKDTMSKLTGYVGKDSLPVMVEIVQNFWLHFRKSQLFSDLVGAVLHSFFLRYGKRDIRSFLDEIGITQQMVVREAYAFAVPITEKALHSGYLEDSIRRRLDAFYSHYYAQE